MSFAMRILGCKRGFQAQPRVIDPAPENGRFWGTAMRHMDDRLCDTSTTSRQRPKTCHFVRHFIKVPQTMAWGDSQHPGWINYAGLGLEPHFFTVDSKTCEWTPDFLVLSEVDTPTIAQSRFASIIVFASTVKSSQWDINLPYIKISA